VASKRKTPPPPHPGQLASFLKPSSAPPIWLRSVNRPSPVPEPQIGFVFPNPLFPPLLGFEAKKSSHRALCPPIPGSSFTRSPQLRPLFAAENQSAAA
jgi:hypothetical protein